MNILVCIKSAALAEDRISRFDEFALEAALQVKDAAPDADRTAVHVITMGPATGSAIIRRALGMGADKGIHVVCETDTDLVSSHVTAACLSAAADRIGGYDLILTGIMSEDMMAGHTGPMFAEMSGIPSVAGVLGIDLPVRDNHVAVFQETDGGTSLRQIVELPCVLCIQPGINTPRYPTLSKMLAADQTPVVSMPAGPLIDRGRLPVQTALPLEKPEKNRTGDVLEGSLDDKADRLISILKKRHLL